MALYMGVFAIKCTKNGKVYIGSSPDVEVQIHDDIAYLNVRHHHNKELQTDWNRYTKIGFEIFDIATVDHHTKIGKAKKKAIKEYLSKKIYLYNDVEQTIDNIIVYNIKEPEKIVEIFTKVELCADYLGVTKSRVYKSIKANSIKPSSIINDKFVVCKRSLHDDHINYLKTNSVNKKKKVPVIDLQNSLSIKQKLD